jgi:hypothetical protein
MATKPHKNTLLRIQHVCDITRQHYEEGNLAKCYKQVWRHYVFPVYPMCYHTFLSYLRRGLEGYRQPPKDEQPSLFDGITD